MSQSVKPTAICAASLKKENRVSRTWRTRFRKNEGTTTISNNEHHYHLLSPSSTNSNKEARGEKRSLLPSHDFNDSKSPKRPRLSQAVHEPTTFQEYNPIEYWAVNGVWPKDYIQRGVTMSEVTSNKRKSKSTHRSKRLERLAENGVFIKSSSLIQKSSKDLCHDLIKGDRQPTQHSPFLPEQLSNVLECVQGLNEGRVQRDIIPWVMPSGELLFFCSELDINNIKDKVNVEWTRYATMGSIRPKPDYMARLLLSAFTKDKIQKLRNYASPLRLVFFTPDVCFPFLIYKVMTGEQGLNKAD